MHTLTGLAHDRDSHVAYDPAINEESHRHRSFKLAALQKTLRPPTVFGDDEGELLVVGWGSTKGAIEEAVERLRAEGRKVGSIHLQFLQPMASGIKEIMQRYKKVITVENNWSDDPNDEIIDEDNRRYSQLAFMLRSRYLIDIDCWTEDRARPIKPGTIVDGAARQARAVRDTTMTLEATHCLLKLYEEHHNLEDYQGGVPRWCTGCGDNGILAAVQRLCRDNDLRPEKTMFVSGIGCSSRLPHYMKTYGFHGIHGRALPVAEGIKMARPDLDVFVSTGDGDCCSIGAAHWIHAIRYNMNMTVMLHDNHVYGLTKKQASPTSPRGFKSNTTPRGSYLEALNPLTVTLGVQNVSFVAQAVDWIPEVLYDILSAAYRHKGLSFVRIIQRCPEFLPKMFDPWLQDPQKSLILTHERGLQSERRPRQGLSQSAGARSEQHRSRPRDRLARGSDPGRHPVSERRSALLRGASPRRPAADVGLHPRRSRGGVRQVHHLAVTRTESRPVRLDQNSPRAVGPTAIQSESQ